MNALIFIVFFALFVLFMFALLMVAEGRKNPLATLAQWIRPARQQPISQSGLDAMRRAGYQGGAEHVQLTDIGLLAYRQTDEPKLVRYGDVLLDTRYLRPFVELALPFSAAGVVRFELVDSDGRVRYVDETRYHLKRGINTLLPNTWLPLEGKEIDPGRWMLRVLAGETLLGVHIFGWRAVGGGSIQRYTESDGEISPELLRAMQSRPRAAVSLSELLADQEE